MPRDANGNFTLFQPGNPVETDTNIESTWANNTLQDIAAEITDSLSRQGKGALTGPLQVIDEQTGVPGLAFGAEPTSGLKRSGTGDVRMQVQGSDRMRWRAGASQVPEVQVAGVWKEVALLEASSKLLRGIGGETTLYFYNLTVPAAAGWSPVVPDANIRTLMVGGTGGTIAGSEDPSAQPVNTTVTVNLPAATDDYTLQQADVPNLQYKGGEQSNCGSGDTRGNTGAPCTPGWNSEGGVTKTTLGGGGGPHSHGIGGTAAGTGTGTLTPRYAMGVLGQLDA